jgi:hypothetical protein
MWIAYGISLWPRLRESHRPRIRKSHRLRLRLPEWERHGAKMRELGGRLGLQIWRQQTHLHRLLLGHRVAHRGVKRLARSE